MLYWIAKLLALHYSAFHVFSYLTLRAILAVMSALWVPASNMAALLSHILTAPGSGMHGG